MNRKYCPICKKKLVFMDRDWRSDDSYCCPNNCFEYSINAIGNIKWIKVFDDEFIEYGKDKKKVLINEMERRRIKEK